jgi:acetyltransferase-like isoleucine patch superfamily enzyme
MTFIVKAKELYWSIREDWEGLRLRVLLWLPLKIGVKARNLFLPSILGGMGEKNNIQAGIRLTNPKKFCIGSNCEIAQGVFITAGGGVRLGDWVGIGPDAKIWSVNHRFSDPDTPWILQGWDYKEVIIEDDVWVGANAFVMPGVHVGKGAIISACTVVSKSVPPYAVMSGNPGRVVGWRKKPENPEAGN